LEYPISNLYRGEKADDRDNARRIHHNFGDGNPVCSFADPHAGSDGARKAVQAQGARRGSSSTRGITIEKRKGIGGCHRGRYRSKLKAQISNIQYPISNYRAGGECLEDLGEIQAIDELKRGEGASKVKKFKLSVNGNWHEIEIKDLDASPIPVLVDGELYQVELGAEVPDTKAVEEVREEPATLAPEPAPETSKPAVSAGGVIAPMPGKILAVNVGVGDRVQHKEVLCTLEAMKMENEIMAPAGGVVKEVRVAEGQDVLYGDVLLVIG